MKIRMFRRFYFTTALIIVVCFGFMVLTLSFFVSNHLSGERYRDLERNCDAVNNILISVSDNADAGSVLNLAVKSVATASNAEIFLTDLNGKAYYCSCDVFEKSSSCEHTLANIPSAITQKAINGSLRKMGDLNSSLSQVSFIAAKKIGNESVGEYIVYSVSPASKKATFFDRLFGMYLISAVIPLVLIFVAEYVLIYRIAKPLKMMSAAAKAMSTGDFSKRIPVVSDDEIGQLAISFNQMTNALAKLEGARRSFVANVSHEFRTPMTTIGGFIDGIIDGTIEVEKQEYYLKIVSKEVKRLTRLVHSMLSLSRLESGETVINAKSFDMREVLLNIVISQEQRIESKNIKIIGLDTIEETKIIADMDLVHQAIYNLVDNAVKFTDENGYIAFKMQKSNNGVIFKIKNSGAGVSEKDRQHIFERFYKKDRSRSENTQSTGLGLYIVKTIINVHGGTITVLGEENNYTEFIVNLPNYNADNKGANNNG